MSSPLRNAILTEIQANTEGFTFEEAQNWVKNDASCISGSVSGLIYYHQTLQFFDEHEEEILELASDYEFDLSVVKEGMTGFKNQMAWFAFEALANNVFEGNEAQFKNRSNV